MQKAHLKHKYTLLFCLQAREGKEGGKPTSCTTCFSQVQPGDGSAVTSESCLLIIMRNNLIRHSLEGKQNRVYLLPSFCHGWGGAMRQHVDSESNILSILVVAPSRRKHLPSAKYGHFPENWVNQVPDSQWHVLHSLREDKTKKKKNEGGVPAVALSNWSPFQGPQLCLHAWPV